MTEIREHEVREVARFFKIPVAMIGDLSRATWSNFEQQQLQYYVQCIRPWLVNVEQELSAKLVSPLERSQQCIEHVTEGFLRADVEKRGTYYNLMLNTGVMSINEVREKENLAPIAGGDVHRVPMNTEALEAPAPESEVTPARAAITLSAHRDLLLDVLSHWEAKVYDRAARMHTRDKLKTFAEQELSDPIRRAQFVDAVRVGVRAWAATQAREADTETICQGLADSYFAEIFPSLIHLVDTFPADADFGKMLQQRLSLWQSNSALAVRMVDYLIQHGEAPAPKPAPRRLSLELARKHQADRVGMADQHARATHTNRIKRLALAKAMGQTA